MLEIDIPDQEYWDEEHQEFINIPGTHLKLEHSLISLQKWESKCHIPFFATADKTYEEVREYIMCMTINEVKDKSVYQYIPDNQLEKIINYIKDPMTATWFNKKDNTSKLGTRSREVITAEVIYYWMIELGIPMECQKWHLNQLMTLIKVINVKSTKKPKRNKNEIAQEWAALNAKRRSMYNTRG